MDDLKSQVIQLIDNGVPEAEIGAFIQKFQSTNNDESKSDKYQPSYKSPGFIGASMESDNIETTKSVISKGARFGLEMGGLATGAIVGSGAGPVGTVAGAATLYAAGSNIADRLDEFLNLQESMDAKQASKKAISDIKTGAMYEMGGQLINAGAYGLAGVFRAIKAKFPALSNKQILVKARDILKKVRAEDEILAKTGEKSEALLKRRGIETEPTFAQKTGGKQAAAFEQSVTAKDKEIMAILRGNDANINKEVLESVEKEFAHKGSIEDVISGVREHLKKLVTSNDLARAKSTTDIANLITGRKTQDIGKETINVLREAKFAEKRLVDAAYKKVPGDTPLGKDDLKNAIFKVVKDYNKKGGGSDSLPKSILKQIRKELKAKGSTTKFEKLQDFDQQIGEEMRECLMGRDPNLKRYRRLKMLKDGVDSSMDQLLASPNADVALAYANAKKIAQKYFLKFKDGMVGDVLQVGRQASGLKIEYSAVPSRFFSTGKMDAADDLIRALGKKDATKAIDDFAGRNLLSSSLKDGEINAPIANKWLTKNKEVLEKYGLFDKYKTIVKNKEVSDVLVKEMESYTKTVANKVLDVDINKIIPNLFSGAGAKSSGKIAHELMNTPGIKGNKLAETGIQNGFKDFFVDSIKTTAVDDLGNPVMSIAKAHNFLNKYKSAIRQLYKNNPSKVQALYDYHDVLRMLNRNKIISYAGGSTTAEKATPFEGVGTNIAQYIAVQHGAGWKFSVLKNLWKSIFGGPGRFSNQQIEALLSRAVYDPEVAKTIMEATKPVKNITALDKKLTQHLITLGIYSTHKTGEMIYEEIND